MDEQLDTKNQIFALMAMAEDTQKAAQAAIALLAKERAAFAKGQAMLADQLAEQVVAVQQAAISVSNVTGDVKRATGDAIPGLINAVSGAIGVSVRDSLAGASETAARALSEAARPTLDSLSGVRDAAGDAERSLKNAGWWFAWKWVPVAAGGLAGVCLVAYAALAWQLHQVSSLREEKAALQADIVQMQATADALEKRGGRIVMSQCGGRLCIEASSNQGKNQDGSAAALGSWGHDDGRGGRVKLVIPRGY